MIRLAIHDTVTGRIAGIVWCDAADAALQPGAGQAAIEVADNVRDDTHHVSEGAAVARPALPDLASATVAAGAALAGFPAGALVRVSDATLGLVAVEATLDDDEIVFPYAAAWTVEVLDAWPSLPRVYAVTAT